MNAREGRSGLAGNARRAPWFVPWWRCFDLRRWPGWRAFGARRRMQGRDSSVHLAHVTCAVDGGGWKRRASMYIARSPCSWAGGSSMVGVRRCTRWLGAHDIVRRLERVRGAVRAIPSPDPGFEGGDAVGDPCPGFREARSRGRWCSVGPWDGLSACG